MPNNSGTLVVSPIRPQNDSDTFPSAYANELKGGFHQVADITARNNISSDRRQVGMWCYVIATGQTFQLVGGIANANWTLILTITQPYLCLSFVSDTSQFFIAPVDTTFTTKTQAGSYIGMTFEKSIDGGDNWTAISSFPTTLLTGNILKVTATGVDTFATVTLI